MKGWTVKEIVMKKTPRNSPYLHRFVLIIMPMLISELRAETRAVLMLAKTMTTTMTIAKELLSQKSR
jgi:hypothetical protein